MSKNELNKRAPLFLAMPFDCLKKKQARELDSPLRTCLNPALDLTILAPSVNGCLLFLFAFSPTRIGIRSFRYG